jgi:hypothetical protein
LAHLAIRKGEKGKLFKGTITMEDQIPYLLICPRCKERTYEKLRTHSSCYGCLYSPTLEEDSINSDWTYQYIQSTREKVKKALEEKEDKAKRPTKRKLTLIESPFAFNDVFVPRAINKEKNYASK